MIRMTVQDGKMVQTLSLTGEKVFLGRLPGNTVPLSDPSVSRKHALIRKNGAGEVELLDLNSRHGVRRNGEVVRRAVLAAGDELMVGEVKVRVEAVESSTNGGAASAVSPDAKKVLLSDVHRTSFSEEFYGQLRSTPWWAASLCFHMALLWLLFSVPFFQGAGDEGLGSVTGEVREDFTSFFEDRPRSAREIRPEDDFEAEPLLAPPVNERMPVDAPLLEERIREFRRPQLGPAATDFSSTPRMTSPFTSPEIPDLEFGEDGAASANEQAGEILKKALTRRAGDTLGILRRMKPREILVVTGHYDKVETVLDLLDLTLERRQEVTIRGLERTSLEGRKILIVNCSNERPSPRTLERIREFVAGGGYLLTTDWGIENVLKDAFPGYVEPLLVKGRNEITPNEVIRIHAVPDQRSHFLLRGTSFAHGDTKWWLEESTYPFVVKKKDAVEILLESDEMEKEYGTRAVAATFRYGSGRVLHMLGHFFQKEGNLRGAFSTQRLIANFLVSSVRGK